MLCDESPGQGSSDPATGHPDLSRQRKIKPPVAMLVTDPEPPVLGAEELQHRMGTSKTPKTMSVLFLEWSHLCPKRTRPVLLPLKYCLSRAKGIWAARPQREDPPAQEAGARSTPGHQAADEGDVPEVPGHNTLGSE